MESEALVVQVNPVESEALVASQDPVVSVVAQEAVFPVQALCRPPVPALNPRPVRAPVRARSQFLVLVVAASEAGMFPPVPAAVLSVGAVLAEAPLGPAAPEALAVGVLAVAPVVVVAVVVAVADRKYASDRS